MFPAPFEKPPRLTDDGEIVRRQNAGGHAQLQILADLCEGRRFRACRCGDVDSEIGAAFFKTEQYDVGVFWKLGQRLNREKGGLAIRYQRVAAPERNEKAFGLGEARFEKRLLILFDIDARQGAVRKPVRIRPVEHDSFVASASALCKRHALLVVRAAPVKKPRALRCMNKMISAKSQLAQAA